MAVLDDDLCLEMLKAASRRYGPDSGAYSLTAEQRDGQTFLVVQSQKALGLVDQSLEFTADEQELAVPIVFETGPGVFDLTFDIEKGDYTTLKGLDGGQAVRPQNAPIMGTLGASFEYFSIKIDRRSCVGRNVLISNNHVIANHDSAPNGTPIEIRDASGGWRRVGRLSCKMPMKKRPVFDLAMAEIDNPDPSKYRNIPGIGRIARVAGPRTSTIYKKSGIATGVTSGPCVGRTVWYRWHFAHHGWKIRANGFGCPGDSGSLIMNGDTLSGILTAGDSTNCSEVTEGWFLGFETKNSGRSPRTDVAIFEPTEES